MKLSTKIGGKWTFSVVWIKIKHLRSSIIRTRITFQRNNTVTPSIYQQTIHNTAEEFFLLTELAEIAFALGYEGKPLIQFVIEYKNQLSEVKNPHEAVYRLKQDIKELDFAKRKFKRAVQSLSK